MIGARFLHRIRRRTADVVGVAVLLVVQLFDVVLDQMKEQLVVAVAHDQHA